MTDPIIKKIATFISRRWKTVLWSALGITIVATALSGLLFQNIRYSWIDLVPQNAAVTKEYKKIIKNFNSASSMIITIEGKNRKAVTEAIRKIGPELARQKNIFRSVVYKNNMNFQKKYALLMTKKRDLRSIRDYRLNFALAPYIKGINDTLEADYIADSGNMRKQEKNISLFLKTIKEFLSNIKQAAKGKIDPKEVKRIATTLSTGPEFMISPDGKMGIITAMPIAAISELKEVIKTVNKLDILLKKWQKKLPGIKLGQTGMHTLTRDEMRTSEKDSMFVTILAFVFIILLLIYAFQMKSAPILGMLSLTAGILLTLALTYIFIGSLNLMTAMTAAILLGLGIDYSVHILAQFTEARADGEDTENAIVSALARCGRGLVIGALTTAAAFLILILIPFKALAELGFVTALGITCTMLSSFFLLPSLLIFKEKKFPGRNRPQKKNRSFKYHFIANTEKRINRFPLLTVILITTATIFLFIQATKIQFSGDLKEIEAKNLQSLLLNDLITEKFNMTSDSIMIASNTLKEDQKFYRLLEKNEMISFVESISLYLPSKKKQADRAKIIQQIRSRIKNIQPTTIRKNRLTKEIERFRKNMLELRDLAHSAGLDRLEKRCKQFVGGWKKTEGKNFIPSITAELKNFTAAKNRLLRLQQLFYNEMYNAHIKLLSAKKITLKDIPEDIKKRLISKDGKKYLLTAWLLKDNWKNISGNMFLKNIEKSSNGRATGMVMFMRILVDTASKEGKNATLLTLSIILLLIMIDFKNIRASLFAFINLVFSAICMIGTMYLIGENMNFVNVLAIPLIIGIGIDDSVHIIHRYRGEEPGNIAPVLASTGRAVFLTSITTMIGFGSLYFADFQGFKSFGLFLFCGVGFALFNSVIFLPALLRLTPKIFKKKHNS